MTDRQVNKSTKKINKTPALIKKSKNKLFPIIALGGSAGSFHAFEKFFRHMPANNGICFIIIMHLDPEHQGNVSELIQNFTPMPVFEAKDGTPVKPDTVFIIPPNKDMGIHNRKLLLLPPASPKGHRLPIDYFFQSLAEDQWNKAVAIIFSGMGSDGETGLRMIREKLGMIMVQDPTTAQYPSMPKAAIDTNLVDFVLSPEEMPIKLIQYLNHPILADETSEQFISETKNANAIQKILMLLRSNTGHDFTLYKKNTIVRRIDRRIAFHQLPDYIQYVEYLRENPHETTVLFHELLIGVTKFFRDTQAFDALRDKLFAVLETKSNNDPVRIWVAGCSTGEEAYSIAILVMEYLNALKSKKHIKVQIFATDLDMDAIEYARAGIYHENIIADVSEERIETFFNKKNEGYSVKKELREMIVFAQHNIIKDAPFTKLDLLCCRNVMIYLRTELQKKIIPIFHYSLNPKGIYFMGPAETVGGFTEMFTPLDSRWKIFERKEGSSLLGKMLDFPFNVSTHNVSFLKPEELEKIPRKKTLADSFNYLMIKNYTPPSVLINEKGDIIYINGNTKKLLELSPGEAAMNIYRMVREDLKYTLNNSIQQARTQKGSVIGNEIKLKEPEGIWTLNIQVSFLEANSLQGLILVVFEDKGLVKTTKKTRSKQKENSENLAYEELERELTSVKEQLTTTVEQMETSLEELKSTNEELQSTNEELQSTNEEALTTKEEMQSLNEELMTINVQYQSKAEELTLLNNDMKNMLDNTEIGTIFLDHNLNILRFTPQIKKLFNVIPADVGRSITHIASNFIYPPISIEDELREVLDRLVVKELEVKTKTNDWYNLRIMPYRTLDNFISGVVLTINKITSFKTLEKNAQAYRLSIKKLMDAFPNAALLIDSNHHVIDVNKHFLKSFAVKRETIVNTSIFSFLHESWKIEKLDKFLLNPAELNGVLTLEHDFPGAGKKTMKVSASQIHEKNMDEPWVILFFTDDN